MTLSRLGSDSVSRACAQAKVALETMRPVLDELNVLFNAQGGFSSTILQADLDGVASFSGLTKQQLLDGLSVLVSLQTTINQNISQLAQLATRA